MKDKNMSIEEVIKYVSRELCHGKDAESKCSVNVVTYKIEFLGTEMFSRAENTIIILQNLGIDIQHKIILGANHENIDGVILKECWYEYINDICKDNSEVKTTSI